MAVQGRRTAQPRGLEAGVHLSTLLFESTDTKLGDESEWLKAMAGQGPLTIRDVARRVGRDVKAVHGDVHALIDAGLLDKTAKNQVVFPFEAVRVDFTLRAA